MGVVVPEAEGEECAGLLIELEVDALQLPCTHQFVMDDGCRALALQAVLTTSEENDQREDDKEDMRKGWEREKKRKDVQHD